MDQNDVLIEQKTFDDLSGHRIVLLDKSFQEVIKTGAYNIKHF